MATQSDVDQLNETFQLELALISHKLGLNAVLILNKDKIQLLLSRLAYSTLDKLEMEKFLSNAAY
jgi:hypothetical protein